VHLTEDNAKDYY